VRHELVADSTLIVWCIAPTESGELAEELMADAVARHDAPPGQLTVHADLGSSMTSSPVVELLAFWASAPPTAGRM
jgi:hypothetical protein